MAAEAGKCRSAINHGAARINAIHKMDSVIRAP